MKISELNVIVHPLFSQATKSIKMNKKSEKLVTQNELHAYGEIVKKAKDKKNSLVLLVETDLPYKLRQIDPELKKNNLDSFVLRERNWEKDSCYYLVK